MPTVRWFHGLYYSRICVGKIQIKCHSKFLENSFLYFRFVENRICLEQFSNIESITFIYYINRDYTVSSAPEFFFITLHFFCKNEKNSSYPKHLKRSLNYESTINENIYAIKGWTNSENLNMLKNDHKVKGRHINIWIQFV